MSNGVDKIQLEKCFSIRNLREVHRVSKFLGPHESSLALRFYRSYCRQPNHRNDLYHMYLQNPIKIFFIYN